VTAPAHPARTLVSLSHASTLPTPPGVDVTRRPSDWGKDRRGKLLGAVSTSVRLALAARRYDRLVVVTAGVELFLLAALVPSRKLVAVDWLMPISRRLDAFPLLRRVRFHVVRRSDEQPLRRRFGAQAIGFVPFPAPTDAEPASEGPYLYSAGWAHRDWDTLLAALRIAPRPAIISAGVPLPASDTVQVVPQLSPGEGRRVMRGALAVVLPFVETEAPSGPLVLLDAMAHGKALVVTDVGGTRDYVDAEREALVVAPHDPVALAEAIERITADPALRERLGAAAKARAAEYTGARFWATVLGPGVTRG
jgi:glycosyltransferase involved in cell wall biosynthesis